MLVTQPNALAVNASLPVNNAQELLKLIKDNPGKYNFGSIGNGSLSHLSMEAMVLMAGSKMVHIPYPGSPAAMTALMRNDVQVASLPAIAVTPTADPNARNRLRAVLTCLPPLVFFVRSVQQIPCACKASSRGLPLSL